MHYKRAVQIVWSNPGSHWLLPW